MTNQKVVLSDSSLLLEFDQSSDIESAKEKIEEFFLEKQYSNVETKILKQILLDQDQIKLIFKNNEQKNLKLTM